MKTILSTCKKFKLIIDKKTFETKGFWWAFHSGIIIELSTFKIYTEYVIEIGDKIVGNKNHISHNGQGKTRNYWRVELCENDGFIVESKGFPQNVIELNIKDTRQVIIEFKIPK